MSTRLYFSQIASPILPVVHANWNVITGNSPSMVFAVYDGSASITVTSGMTAAAAVRKLLIRQFISRPLAAQTINGTLTGQIRMSMSNVTSRTGEGLIYFRIINPDGTIASEVGSLTTIALTTSSTNRTKDFVLIWAGITQQAQIP
jgi:hypothetical protein